MKVYSASEAVWPALERTYTYLFRSFRWETFLKLSCVATLCEGFLVSFRFYIPASLPFNVNLRAWQSFLFARDFLPVTIFAGAALFLIGIYCFYLVTRLRFASVSYTHPSAVYWPLASTVTVPLSVVAALNPGPEAWPTPTRLTVPPFCGAPVGLVTKPWIFPVGPVGAVCAVGAGV